MRDPMHVRFGFLHVLYKQIENPCFEDILKVDRLASFSAKRLA